MPDVPAVDRWEALKVAAAKSVFDALGVRWWVAGGWAIDLFVGRETRGHADIDVAMLRRDGHALRELFGEYEVYIAHDGELLPWDGAELAEEHHQFWATRRGSGSWTFEVLLERHEGERWIWRRDASVSLPLPEFGRMTVDGAPYVAPQVALLYKAKGLEIERNGADFRAAVGSLDGGARAWLREVLVRVYGGGHPWVGEL